jgi:hypothetical protein
MVLAAKGWRLRQTARQALEAADEERALDAASQAERTCHTQEGAFLRVLAAWLTVSASAIE